MARGLAKQHHENSASTAAECTVPTGCRISHKKPRDVILHTRRSLTLNIYRNAPGGCSEIQSQATVDHFGLNRN
jgi:hypothetical protein